MRHFIGSLRLLLEHQHTESKTSTEFCIQHFTDPEPIYYMARHLVQLGEPDRALGVLNDVVDRGFLLSSALTSDPWLAPLHARPAYDSLLQRTRRLEEEAALAFARMGGSELAFVVSVRV